MELDMLKRRTPYGVRGLKLENSDLNSQDFFVALRIECVD